MKVKQKPTYFLSDMIIVCVVSAILSGMIVYTVFIPAPSRPHNVAPQPSTPPPTLFVNNLNGSITTATYVCPEGFVHMNVYMENSECFPSGTTFYSVYRTNGSTIETKVVISAISYDSATNTTTIHFTGGTIRVNSYPQSQWESVGGQILYSYTSKSVNMTSFKGQALFGKATIGSPITLAYHLQTTYYDVAVMPNGKITPFGTFDTFRIIFTGFSV